MLLCCFVILNRCTVHGHGGGKAQHNHSSSSTHSSSTTTTRTTAVRRQRQQQQPHHNMQLQQQQQWRRRRQAPAIARPRQVARRRAVPCRAVSSPFKVQLLHPVKGLLDADTRPLLVFLPGTDGTGQAITPQIPALVSAGYDIRSLYVPPDDRSGWEQLQAQVLYLLALLLASRPPGPNNVQVTLVAESFGGALALRIAAAAPQLIKAIVLVNPATCYNQSLGGLTSFVAASNLLGLFPQNWYSTAQGVLLPFLVDIERVGPAGADALRSMIFMEPPPDYETTASEQLGSLDDAEQDASALNLAATTKRQLWGGPGGGLPAPGGPRLPGRSSSRAQSSSSSSGGSRLMAAAAAMGVFSQAAGGSGWGGGSVFGPAAAANFRANLMRSGNLPDAVLRELEVPCLIISSAKDRMLPSITEGARLARLLPHSRRVILPDSGHAALLETGLDLAAIMHGSGISPAAIGPTALFKQRAASSNSSSRGPGSPRAAPAAGSSSAGPAVLKSVLLNVVPDQEMLAAGQAGLAAPRPATLFPSAAAAAGTASAGAAASTAGANDRSSSPVPAAAASAGAESSNSSVAGGDGSRPASSSPSVSSSVEEAAAEAEVDRAFDEWSQLLAPWRDLVSPVLLGQEHLPGLLASGRPLLFVANHQKMGLYDTPLFAYEMYMRGFKLKGLAHPGHWGGPLGPFFERFGAVKAGPMTAFKLLRANEQVLLFPGGAREVNKRVGQEYQLLWKDTPDFVRLAARCGAIIVPFAAVGADDAYDVLVEADDLLAAPLLGDAIRGALKRLDPSLDPREAALPLTRLPGLGLPSLIPVPNIQRLYFRICQPVDTLQLGLDVKADTAAWQTVYDDIRATVVGGMEELLEVRAADDQRQLGDRIRRAVDSWLPALDIAKQPPRATAGGDNSLRAQQQLGGTARQKQ